MKSKLVSLNINDFWKSLLVTVITAILTTLYQMLEVEGFNLTWANVKVIILAGLTAGIAYLLKNLGTNSEGKILKKEREPKQY